MTSPRNLYPVDYTIDHSEAFVLSALPAAQHDQRVRLLNMYADSKGNDALISLFSQFIAIANSVVANTRDFIELYLITECGHYPDDAEKINLPDMFGALQGLALAKDINQEKTCQGCAFRQGTCANQSPMTTMEARYQVDNNEVFMCHLDADNKPIYKPTGTCRGWAQAVKTSMSGQS